MYVFVYTYAHTIQCAFIHVYICIYVNMDMYACKEQTLTTYTSDLIAHGDLQWIHGPSKGRSSPSLEASCP